MDVGRTLEGCLLFPKGDGAADALPARAREVPADAGGIWNLG